MATATTGTCTAYETPSSGNLPPFGLVIAETGNTFRRAQIIMNLGK